MHLNTIQINKRQTDKHRPPNLLLGDGSRAAMESRKHQHRPLEQHPQIQQNDVPLSRNDELKISTHF